jgi:hypothetical protein
VRRCIWQAGLAGLESPELPSLLHLHMQALRFLHDALLQTSPSCGGATSQVQGLKITWKQLRQREGDAVLADARQLVLRATAAVDK